MDSNLSLLNYFKETYLNKQLSLKIINVGYSKEKDCSSLFEESCWEYNVLDSDYEHNVDIPVVDINYWDEVVDETCDVVISNSFMNFKYFWLVMFQVERILKPKGYVCIIVPNGHSVKDSSDSLNIFTRNSLKSLAEYVNLNIVEIIEKDSELCLVAQKGDVAEKLFIDSYEKDAFKTKCNTTLEKYESKLKELDKFNSNPELTSILAEIKHILFDFNSSRHVFCPICSSIHNTFSPFGNPARLNAKCPKCNSLEKDRLIYLFLTQKQNILNKNIKLLHLEPDLPLYNIFKNLNSLDYVSAGVTLKDGVDNIIDFENIDFPEDTFDVTLLDYSILNNYEDSKNILKELYRVIKPNDDAFVLINFSSLDNEDYFDADEFTNQLENIGFDVAKYDSQDIVDAKLIETYGVTQDNIFICRKNI